MGVQFWLQPPGGSMLGCGCSSTGCVYQGQHWLWGHSIGVHQRAPLPMKTQYQMCPPGGSTAHMERVLAVLTMGKHSSYRIHNSGVH